MPSTTFTDQFFLVSPTSPSGTSLTVHRYLVEDKTSDGLLSKPGADKINSFNILET
jgi:hypothetical protein